MPKEAGGVKPLSTNKEIEDAAIAWVIDYERSQGRTARDTRKKGPTDLDSPPLKIEVKAYGVSGRGYDLWLEPPQYAEAKTNPDFRLYIVENVRQGDAAQFTLRSIEGNQLAKMVERAREKKHYELPWSTAVYDKMSVKRFP
jgi:hypothetical protein